MREKLSSVFTTKRDSMLKEASALFRAGDKAAALAAYKALLTDYPDLPNSWFNMALCQRDA